MRRGAGIRGRRAVCALLAAMSLVVSGCGLNVNAALPFDVGPGSIRPVPELEGVEITVGSKDFTENTILAYITQLALKAAGAKPIDFTNITGSNGARAALENGQIDLMWEYTGTGWLSYLGYDQPLPTEQEQYDAVREADLERNGIVWLPYSEVNNTYGFATTEEYANKHGLRTMTEVTDFLKRNPQEAVFCVDTEFANRPDGLPGVRETYGFPTTTTKTFGSGAIYAAVVNGTCNFGEVFTTDGRIAGLRLRVMEDDKKFFPQYNAALTLREDFHRRYPEIAEIIAPITEELDNTEIIELNKQVDVDGRDAAEVARDWLVAKGFITAG
ncbi:glycine betaine ABC transporter substrate-binding protein [Saccharomonospora xinjiangensis]|uniref:Periplasmic glycine betaine/choline-binding (Lipo)protein of an ABC-type transport system (Osmoprotectant binding protein) n=1 Tax=Saccharomonospora xinjiangensis XJ-54 TaxID=882086 RepID=I0V280_9PSEU|nr:glycine betaine ABC transporter substrate-binding protein [Saccharomonospora xinjiangensis]EID54233.1 periplasmic glycine betaine/choline-binding (lipo)protein of an ABC-type transport system (osmoprotectant binding protein) [Saccharomonospora xinjiangensis XJ-54]